MEELNNTEAMQNPREPEKIYAWLNDQNEVYGYGFRLVEPCVEITNELHEQMYSQHGLWKFTGEGFELHPLPKIPKTPEEIEEDMAAEAERAFFLSLPVRTETLEMDSMALMMASAESYETMFTDDMNQMLAIAETYETMYAENMMLMEAVASLYEMVVLNQSGGI